VQFVGRDGALAVLGSALDRVVRGQPALVVVRGEPGMGKTTLIGRFLETIPAARVGRTSGLEAEVLIRYGVAGTLLRALTSSARLRPDDDITGVGERLLAAISGGSGPTTLVVDDAQWADVASLQALTFALRRLDSDPVLTIIGTRDRTGGDAVGRLVEAAQGEAVELAALTVAEVAEVGRRHGVPLSPAAAKRLHAHTGGLPLHVVALLRELDPPVLDRARGPLPAPRSFAGLVHQRLAASPPEARRLVCATAVLGDPVAVALAAAVGQVADPAEALDAAVAAHLVEHHREPAGDFVRFGHDLVRAAVLDGLAPGERLALHARAAAHLDGVEALDQRAAAALLPDDTLAAELDKTAREEGAAGATERAVHHFLEASRLCPDQRAARQLRLDAVEALLLAGEATAARGLLADLPEVDDPARIGYLRGHLALLEGEPAGAEELLRDAWAASDPRARPRLAALIAAQLAQLHTTAARNAEAAAWSALVTRYAGDDERLATSAAATLLASLVFSGRTDEALERVLPQPATAGALRLGRYDDVVGRGLVRLWTDDLSGARADLAAVADPVRTGRPMRIRLLALAYLAETEFRAGRWDDSLAASELAVSLAEDADHPWLRGLLHGIAALPYAGRGDWAAAEAHVRAGQAASAATDDVMNLVYPAVAGCLLAAARGDHAGVLAATGSLAELNPANGVMEPTVLLWWHYRVAALVATGALAEAGALLAVAGPLAHARGRRSALVALARARGEVLGAQGDGAAATQAFEDGVSLLDGFGLPFEAAQLRLTYGTHLRRLGQRRAAGLQLGRAIATFEGLGAAPYLDRGRQELAASGLAPRSRGPAVPALTPREHAVARLVAEGLTNREIAERLVVSVKTAEYHLGNAYTKLGVRSRAQLVARLAGGSGTGT
jgi:DNA-binding CsgD family transcriptional regulator